MKENKRFKLDIYGLRNGTHEFNFEFGNELFEKIEESLIEKGFGTCAITLVKKDTMMELSFHIDCQIELTCDRSLEKFNYPIQLSEVLIIKYGEAFDDSREDIWVIPANEQSINIEQPLYEYISLAVPMKKLHPKFEEEVSQEQLEFVYSSGDPEEIEEPEEDSNDTDPRWDALKNIKNLN